jgi:polyisoprenoid-binding protein YceI
MTTATAPAITTWNADPAHTTAEFKVKHMMISNVKGTVKGIHAILKLNDADPALSTVEATIPLSTLSTGDNQRDGHLKSADFFDVEKFPTMSFQSTGITQSGDDVYSVVGELTIHGVTRPVSFSVSDLSTPSKDPWGNTRIGLTATTRINRKDFGLIWNSALESGGVLVGEEVTIAVDAEFIKA